jgi:hypothetical protein
MSVADRLREIAEDIRGHFPHHAETLVDTADRWKDIAAKERAAQPPVPVAESVDLDAAQAQVTADTAADEELLAASTEATPAITPELPPVTEPAPAATP